LARASSARIPRAAATAGRASTVDAGSPLAGCPSLLLTPHVAGVTRESNARVSTLIADKVAAALGGGN